MSHGIIWLLGLVGIAYGSVRLKSSISGRVKAEAELRKTADILENIFDTKTALIAYMDTDFNFIRVNDKYAESGGHDQDYYIGKNHFGLYPNEENEAIFRQVVDTGKPITSYAKPFEYKEFPERGVTYWDWSLSPVEDSMGNVEALVLMTVDVTDRKRAEIELRDTRTRLEYLLKSTPAVIYTCRASGDYGATYISDNIKQQMGYKPEEFTGDPRFWRERIHPDDVSRVFDDLKNIFETEYHTHEYRFLNREGKYLWLYDELRVIYGEDGKPSEMVGYWVNITERKRAEEEIRDTNERLNTLINAIPDIIYFKDAQFRHLAVNRAFEEFVGIKQEDAIGKTNKDLLPPFLYEHCQKADEELLESGKSVLRLEEKFDLEDGKEVFLETTKIPLFDEQGKPKGLVGLTRDITERKKDEQILAESEKFLHDVIDGVAEPIMIIEKDYKIVMMNRAAREQAWGLSEKTGPLMCYEISHGSETPCSDIEHPCPLERVRESGEPYTVIHLHKDKAGGTRFIEIIASPLVDADGSFRGIIESGRDITERKLAEDEVRRSLNEKEILLKEIHHRVKNNMAVISALLSLQSKYVRDSHDAELFLESRNRIKSMALVHNKLYLSKDLSSIQFEEYIESLTSELMNTYNIDTDKIKLKTIVKDVTLGIDYAVPCGLIINELITNCLKHAFREDQAGEISIEMTHHEDKLRLVVSDNGSGMPESIDISNPNTFGLEIVKALVQQIYGTLELDRTGGSTFTIVFPQSVYAKRV
jgi:PAS domain S-box-containing protein